MKTFCFSQLYLPDGSQTDVLVTSVVSCNHIFVQQTLHQSYAELARLDNSMSVFYHHTEHTPKLPRPIQGKSMKILFNFILIIDFSSLAGVICAAPTQAGWFRALVTVYNSNDDMAMVKFLDYGGYLYVSADSLRVLRFKTFLLAFERTMMMFCL